MIEVGRRIKIPAEEITFRYARSSGPGGQNVNKLSTKAVLRWMPGTSSGMPEAVKARFLDRFAGRLTTTGELVITSERYRTRQRNVDDCLAKLRAMLAAVATPPKKRKPTKPSAAAVERRLSEKRRRAEKKTVRRAAPDAD